MSDYSTASKTVTSDMFTTINTVDTKEEVIDYEESPSVSPDALKGEGGGSSE